MIAAQQLVAPAILLALIMAGGCCAALIVALMARRDELRLRSEARAALHRAALAESALADLRHRRSAAVAKGNRSRAAVLIERQRAMTDELRHVAAVKKLPPQGALPLEPAGSASPDPVSLAPTSPEEVRA